MGEVAAFSLQAVLEDIKARNAGRPVLTVWKNGNYVIHGERDAEIATRCEPQNVILNLDVATFDYIDFPDLQARVRLHEKLLGPQAQEKGEVGRG